MLQTLMLPQIGGDKKTKQKKTHKHALMKENF